MPFKCLNQNSDITVKAFGENMLHYTKTINLLKQIILGSHLHFLGDVQIEHTTKVTDKCLLCFSFAVHF